MGEICSFPGLHFRDCTSVSLGNALSYCVYIDRQEIESPVLKSLDVTKKFKLNWHNHQFEPPSHVTSLYHMWPTSRTRTTYYKE